MAQHSPVAPAIPTINACDEAIGLLISRCLNRITDGCAAAMTDLDISSQQYGVLHAVYRGRASTPSALARLCFTNTAAITYTLDVLEKKGLLIRNRSNTDRRVIDLELTAAGEALIKDCIPRAINAQNQVLKPLSEAECETLRSLLRRIADQD
jgi:DNA-binding MarR family transcriptional regulator